MTSGSLAPHAHSSAAFLPTSPFLTGPSLPASPFLTSPSLPPSWFLTGPPSHPVANLSCAEVELKKEDYPFVKFWHRQDWWNHTKEAGNSTEFGTEPVRGKSLIAKGINKNAKYIENVDGEPVDGYRIRDIHAHARAIWASFQAVGRAPQSWGKADMEISRHYRREMRLKFPELALCDNDWKADLVATTHYPSWYLNHVKSIMIKEEEATDTALPAGSKRRIADEPPTAGQPKKAKQVIIVLLDLCGCLIF
jgi:hypothetical protein